MANALHPLGKIVTVAVNRDTVAESNEIFHINLSNCSIGCIISDSQGIGIIIDDDANYRFILK